MENKVNYKVETNDSKVPSAQTHKAVQYTPVWRIMEALSIGGCQVIYQSSKFIESVGVSGAFVRAKHLFLIAHRFRTNVFIIKKIVSI